MKMNPIYTQGMSETCNGPQKVYAKHKMDPPIIHFIYKNFTKKYFGLSQSSNP